MFPMPYAAAAMALAAFTMAPTAAVAAEAEARTPLVELAIYEEIELAPDIAVIGAGVTTEAPSAVEAMRRNSSEMRRVIERIKALGVAEEDIQTSGISLYARYDYDQGQQRQIFRGYQASNRVSVKLRAIERTGEVLDALVAAGATDLSGPSFSVEDDSAAKEAARTRAFKRGHAQALAYAMMGGYDDVRLVYISEAIAVNGPVPMVAEKGLRVDSMQASVPVQPGLVSSGVSITVKYEMLSADHQD
ncbi:MAG: hypothetical protein C0510_02715 [Erythrobacter sp.]|nr:hypothetical protein [Erythrobacter sp.]